MVKAKRKFLRGKEARKLLLEFLRQTKLDPKFLSELKPPIELANTDHERIYFVEKEPILIESNGRIFPSLTAFKILSNMPQIIVNMGAIAPICNGADVMAPGIVKYEKDFNEGDFVVVLDEQHRKPIAITLSLYNTKKAKQFKSGKILKNIHHVGDKLWNTLKHLSRRL
ncbi:MAG: DUF1947 domain-containing protein [Candidatus Bathyarchaeota archaeon]|nr:MAG: DUF1947 domain-containing protein [Candidatus Bathyarchaeota archaeon]